jgi:hypothetical protein
MSLIHRSYLVGAFALSAALTTVGCGGGDDSSTTAGAGGSAGASGSSAKGGASGKGGAGGSTGGTSAGGKGGSAGNGATGGTNVGGKGGAAGNGATGGTGGGGKGGAAGNGGTGGGGKGGTGGIGGGGSGGIGGKGGSAGIGGSGGSTGTGAVAAVSTTKVDFGNADCGGAAPGNQTVTVKNTGTAPLMVTASVSGSSAFSIVGMPTLTVAPGASGTVTVAAAAVPASSAAGAAVQGTLTLATNDPANASIKVSLSETPHGATLVWGTPASGSLDFGQQSLSFKASQALVLKNTGNADVTVKWDPSPDAQFDVAPGSATAPAGGSVAALATSFTPNVAGKSSATLTFKTTGAALCGTNASNLALKGEGIVGAVAVSGDLDFGANQCGGAAAAAQTITIKNTGAGDFTYATALGTAFYTLDKPTGTVKAGTTETITVTPAPIPFPSTVAPGAYNDTVTITTTGIPGDQPHLVNLKQSASGAVISFDKTGINFPNVAVNSTTSSGFNVKNDGTIAIDVTLAVDNGAFGVQPTAATTVGAASQQAGTASFTPLDNSQQTGNLSVTADMSMLCQPLPAPIALKGQGLNGGVVLDTNTVDFGQVACGSTATAKTVNVSNNGNASYDWSYLFNGPDAAQFTVTCASAAAAGCPAGATNGTLAPGESAQITVTPKSVSKTNGINALAANIHITSTVIGDTGHDVAVTETPLGAVLKWGAPVAFGNVPVGKNATQDATLTNSGNAPASVTYAIAGDAQYTAPASGTAALGDTAEPVKFAPTKAGATAATTLGVSTTDPICAALPSALPITGTGTIGGFSGSPGSFDFGLVNCGTTAGAKVLQIKNCGTADYNLTSIALTNNQWYTLAVSNTLVPANPACNQVGATVTIIPKQVPQTSAVTPNLYGDTLTVTTDIPADVAHTFPITETAQGAILAMAPTSLTFADTQDLTQGTVNFVLKNTGNAPAGVSYAMAIGQWFSIDSATVNPGTVVDTARFTPTNVQPYADQATLNVSPQTVLCQPLPANTQNNAITLAGNGTATGMGVYSLSPTAWTFGSVGIDDPAGTGLYCGSGANADSHTFTIGNGTNATAAYTATLSGGYTFQSTGNANAAGNVAATSQLNLVIRTPAITLDDAPGTHHDGVLTVVVGGQMYVSNLTTVTAGALFKWQDPNGNNIILLNIPGVGLPNAQSFQMANLGNAELDFFLAQGFAGGQQNFGNIWYYPYGPVGNHAQIVLPGGTTVGEYGYAINNVTTIEALRLAPVTKGVVCSSNFQELVVTH